MDTIEKLKADWLALFDRLIEFGREQEREDMVAMIRKLGEDKLSVGIEDRATVERAQISVPRKQRIARQRVKRGFVITTVRKIVREYEGGGLTPVGIRDIARQRGQELKTPSIRMALRRLDEDHVVVRHNGKWFLSDRAPKPSSGTAGGAGPEPSRQSAAIN